MIFPHRAQKCACLLHTASQLLATTSVSVLSYYIYRRLSLKTRYYYIQQYFLVPWRSHHHCVLLEVDIEVLPLCLLHGHHTIPTSPSTLLSLLVPQCSQHHCVLLEDGIWSAAPLNVPTIVPQHFCPSLSLNAATTSACFPLSSSWWFYCPYHCP